MKGFMCNVHWANKENVGYHTHTNKPRTHAVPTADFRRTLVSNWWKNVYGVQVNCSAGLSLSSKSVVRLTVLPNVTIAMDLKQQNNTHIAFYCSFTHLQQWCLCCMAFHWKKRKNKENTCTHHSCSCPKLTCQDKMHVSGVIPAEDINEQWE